MLRRPGSAYVLAPSGLGRPHDVALLLARAVRRRRARGVATPITSDNPVFAQKCWDDKLRKKFCKALQYWLSERMKGVKLQRNHLSPAEGNLAWDRQEVLHHA